jgi:hypothetical protein
MDGLRNPIEALGYKIRNVVDNEKSRSWKNNVYIHAVFG